MKKIASKKNQVGDVVRPTGKRRRLRTADQITFSKIAPSCATRTSLGRKHSASIRFHAKRVRLARALKDYTKRGGIYKRWSPPLSQRMSGGEGRKGRLYREGLGGPPYGLKERSTPVRESRNQNLGGIRIAICQDQRIRMKKKREPERVKGL